MIDLTSKAFNEACAELRALGLKPVVPPEYENHETIEQNHIISYTPQANLPLPPGTEVHMVVSRGPKDIPIKVPNLEGMTQSLAESTINTYNLKTGRIDDTQYSDTVPAGKVISQYPTAETEVSEGTEVNLIISAGPDPATQTPDVPEPPPVQPDPNTVTREEMIILEGFEGVVNLRVLMDGVEVCNENVDTTMNVSWPVQVTGTGVKELAIYINGVASGTQKVDFTQGSNVQ